MPQQYEGPGLENYSLLYFSARGLGGVSKVAV
jgi:hypothetical protein